MLTDIADAMTAEAAARRALDLAEPGSSAYCSAEDEIARWCEAKEAGNVALQTISEKHMAMMAEIRASRT